VGQRRDRAQREMTLTFEAMVADGVAQGIPRAKVEAALRSKLGMSGSSIAIAPLDERALEKVHEREGDRIMLALGFTSVHFSQARASKQSPGIADRRYYRRPRAPHLGGPWTATNMRNEAIVLWWEVKSATGKQSADERVFQEMVEACGETYVLGTHEALIEWLVAQRLASVIDGILEPIGER
jgi:hypothetical protein